jgi:hypothetical protein
MGERSFVERRRTWKASLRDHFHELEERWNRADTPLAVIHIPTTELASIGADDLCRVGLSDENLRKLQTTRPNLLLVGSSLLLPPVLELLERGAVRPVVAVGAQRLGLAERGIGTLVLHDANRLTPAQQHELHCWLVRHPLKQVILTASERLFPLVLRNTFDADLFFQLNVRLVVIESVSADVV